MATVMLLDVFYVLLLIAGIWGITISCKATRPLTVRNNLSLSMFADWYGYFFSVLLIVLAIAGLCGAFL